MASALVIRPVERTDYAAWKPLWDGYNAHYERVGATALPDAVTQATWARFFDVYEPVHALVAVRGDHMLGLTHYMFHRSMIALHPVCYLADLFTASDARGQGVGRALIEAVYAVAQAAQCPRVYWQTREDNAVARRLYDQVAKHQGSIVYNHVF